MVGALSLSGIHFGSHPTASTSHETRIKMVPRSAPWQENGEEVVNSGGDYKFKYHPHGDERRQPKQAPGALNSVTMPGVSLPKVCAVLIVLFF